jgi:hypothetical protein
MAFSNQTNRITFTGDGGTTAFPFPFKIFQDSDVVVTEVLIASPFTETVQTLTTDYTVAGEGGATGATVTMITAPPITVKLVIERSVPYTQAVTLVDNEVDPAGTTNDALDKSVMLALQNKDPLDRAIKLDITQDASVISTSLPPPVASQAIAWNSAATALENVVNPGNAAQEASDSATAAAASATAASDSADSASTDAASAAASAVAAAASAAAADTSLDGAYDNGNEITVDSNPVTLNASGTGGALKISQDGNQDAFVITNNDVSRGMLITQIGVLSSGNSALQVSSNVTQTEILAGILMDDPDSTGIVLGVENDGKGHGLRVSQEGVLNSGKFALYVHSNVAQTAAELVHIHQDHADSTDTVMTITNDGSARALKIVQNKALTDSTRALEVTSSVAQTTGTSQICRMSSTNGSSDQRVLWLLSSGSGNPLYIENNGAGSAIDSNAGSGTFAHLSQAGLWVDGGSTFASKLNISDLTETGFADKLKGLKMYKYQKKAEVFGPMIRKKKNKPGKKVKLKELDGIDFKSNDPDYDTKILRFNGAKYTKGKKHYEVDNGLAYELESRKSHRDTPIRPDARYYKGYMLDDPSTPDELIYRKLDSGDLCISASENVNFLLSVCKELITRIEVLEAA